MRIFLKRIFRHVYCNLKVQFPEISDEETQKQLIDLQSQYKENLKEKKTKKSVSKGLSKKEQCLVDATTYLLNGNMNITTIAKLTKLKRSEINQLSKRMREKTQILPSKRGKKEELTPIHLEFFKNIMENDTEKKKP